MSIQKTIKCTPEQYRELIKNGRVEINGEIKEFDENVTYDTGYKELIDWYNKIMEAQYKQYEVKHTPMAMKSLEQEYEELTAEGGKVSKDVSAIGYTAIIKSGDIIKVTKPNTGDFYINGELVTNDYTFTGEGYEIVNVWVFESNSDDLSFPPSITDAHNFTIRELDVRNIAQTPVVGDSYKNYAISVRNYNFKAIGIGTRKAIFNGLETFQIPLPSPLEEVESDCISFYAPNSDQSRPYLKRVILPELTTVAQGQRNFLYYATNPELTYYFPKVREIRGQYLSTASPFYQVTNVVIPDTVTLITYSICQNNKTITLNCNRAESISSAWCGSTPTENFTMCNDWQASINIAVASKIHTKDWFIDLFQNKLHDFSSESVTREITIPLAIFNELTAEERAIAENKNWILGGA